MDAIHDAPASLRPRVVFIELRGPADEVAEVMSWIEERALYSDAETLSVFHDKLTCRMNVVVDND